MTLYPRAALCAAFALASLTGAALVARSAAAPRAQEPQIIDMSWPSPETEDKVNRVALRQETVADLMNGHLSLEGAAERFWDLSTGHEDSLVSLRNSIPGESDEQKVVTQLLMFAKVYASKDEARYADRLAQLRSEATSFRLNPVVLH